MIDEANSGSRIGFVDCYCRNHLLGTLNDYYNTNAGPTRLCLNYAFNRSLVMLYPALIAFVIVIINMVMVFIFRLLSEFEKHKLFSQELASRVLKVFIA